MAQKSSNPRWLALKALMLVLQRGRSLDDALQAVIGDSPGLQERDKSLCKALSYGLCRWYFALQPVIQGYLQKPFRKKDLDLELILMLGLFQLSIMKVDPHAAVNETVNLTRAQNKAWAKGLVNAVLRGLIRDQVTIESGFDERSYPDWIIHRITEDWPEQSDAILSAGNQRAPMSLRVDINQLDRQQCQQNLMQQNIPASVHETVETALMLEQPCDVNALPGFSSGQLSVQDAATQLAALLLDCKAGMRVLDACAAPGGKTAHLLQSTPSLDLVAVDQDAKRLKLIDDNLKRAGHTARLVCGDASSPQDWHDGVDFDRILADVPCSASGVIRRHPDIKLLRRASDVGKLVSQQRQILIALWSLLNPGGLLLYSTCSIFKDENERQIDWFVQNNDNCTVIGPNSVQWGEQRPWGRQILPGSQNMDGFYYACLQKIAISDVAST